MNKRNVIKRALALFLILALSSGTAFAQDDAENPGAVSDKGGESASAEGSAAPSEEDGTQEKEDDTQGESGEEYKKEQPEKEIRIIKVEEEYTYICGDIFSLNAELMDEEEFLREESLKEEAREDGESPEEEETSEKRLRKRKIRKKVIRKKRFRKKRFRKGRIYRREKRQPKRRKA